MGDEVDPKLKLYIRLPVRIKDEFQVKDLHPGITRVYVPRQTSKWCIVAFPDNETLESAKSQLKAQKINGKKIYVGPFKKGKNREKKAKAPTTNPESLLDLIK